MVTFSFHTNAISKWWFNNRGLWCMHAYIIYKIYVLYNLDICICDICMYVYLQCPLLTENKPGKRGLPTCSVLFIFLHHKKIYQHAWSSKPPSQNNHIFQPEHHNLLKKDPKSITLAASLEFYPCSIFFPILWLQKDPLFFMFSSSPNKKKTTTAHPVPRSPRFRDKRHRALAFLWPFPHDPSNLGGNRKQPSIFWVVKQPLKMKRCKMFQEKKNGRWKKWEWGGNSAKPGWLDRLVEPKL